MARKPKTTAEAAENLRASVSLIPARYTAGVRGADWESGAGSDAAEANYATRVQEAVQTRSRQAGVRRAGNAKWEKGALEKGAANIGAGVTRGIDAYITNFGQVYDRVLSTITSLPPRGTDPIANIDNRVKPVAMAFRENRIRGSV